MESARVNCHQCKYFYVTWEPNHPNGCRAFGFKCKELPSLVVFKNSGAKCQAFEKKNSPTK